MIAFLHPLTQVKCVLVACKQVNEYRSIAFAFILVRELLYLQAVWYTPLMQTFAFFLAFCSLYAHYSLFTFNIVCLRMSDLVSHRKEWTQNKLQCIIYCCMMTR